MGTRATAWILVVALGVMGMVGPAPARASTHPAVHTELTAAATRLAETSMLPELTETIPGLGSNPGLLLGLHDAFGALAGIGTLDDINDLSAGGFTFNAVDIATDGTSGSFDLSADRSVTAPIMLIEDDVQLLGDDVDVGVSMPATTISFEYDESVEGDESFALVDLPRFELTITIDESVALPVQFGFADATATGTISLATGVQAAVADPDGDGRLTAAEFDTLAIEDLVELSFPSAEDGDDDLDIDLDLTADVFGEEFGGVVTVADEDLFGDPAAAIDFTPAGANPIDLLTNVGPDLAITALSQYVSGFGLAMIGGDTQIPLLGDGILIPGDLGDLDEADFDQVFEVIQPLMDYVEPRSAGQIVCGTTAVAPEDGEEDGIPAGSVRNLDEGEEVHCRAYTAEDADADADDVAWTFTNATVADGDGDLETVGVEPTKNITATMDADGKLDVRLSFTPDGADALVDILPRPDTIQEFLTELAEPDVGLIPTVDGVPDFDYDPDLEAFELPLSTHVDGFERTATANAGNSLVAETGLTGLTASGSSGVGLSFGQVDAAMTLGLIVTDDVADINPEDGDADDEGEDAPGPGDRFFVRTGDEPILTLADLTMTGDLGLAGRLGFLEVEASGSANLTRPDDTSPAFAVGLTDPLGVTVGAHTDPDATLLRDLLRQGPVDSIDATVNLALDADLDVSASAAGMEATGVVEIVEWNLATGNRDIDVDGDFDAELAPFDRADEFTFDGASATDDPTLFTTTATSLLDMPGLVGAYLVAEDGERCQITAVVSDTSLHCTDLQAGDDASIDFENGESYTVRGNTLSHLAEILAAIEELAAYLETVVADEAMGEPLPVVGVTPAELVGQVEELRRMIDGFRGVQAARIACEVQGDSSTDIRAIEVGPSGEATLECDAEASSDSARDVRWRIGGPAGDGEWVEAGDDTVGGGGTVELEVSEPDPSDGFISLGSEYIVEVEWTDRDGDHQAALPARTPRSLQGLAEQVTEVLDLPDEALRFALETASDTELLIDLTYGICSEEAPDLDGDPCDGMPTGPSPEADLNVDLDGGLSLASLETGGEIDVRYAALGQFDLGVPLDGTAPQLYGSTGLSTRLEVQGTDLSVDVSIGPARGVLGSGVGELTGTADSDSDGINAELTDEDVDLSEVPDGAVVRNTTTGEECFASGALEDSLGCTLDWEEGDGYAIGGLGELEAALAFDLEVTGTSGTLGETDSVPFADAGLDFTDLDSFTSGDADCGGIDPDHSDDVVSDSDGEDDDGQLQGIACGRFSLGLDLAGDTQHVGELGIDLDAGGLTVWVPDDLLTQLEDALDLGLVIRALPPMLRSVEKELRTYADSGIPEAIGGPLRTGADGIEEIRGSVEVAVDTFGDALDAATDIDDLEAIVATELEALVESDVLDDDVLAIVVTAYCGEDPCEVDSDNTLADITGLEAELTFGQNLEAGAGVNLGLRGLPLEVEGGVEAATDWEVTFGIGISIDQGPYVFVDGDENEVSVSADVTLLEVEDNPACDGFTAPDSVDAEDYTTDRCLRGRLGFLFIQAADSADNPTGISAAVGLDLVPEIGERLSLSDVTSLRFGVEVDTDDLGELNVDLAFNTGLGDPGTPDLPTVLGTVRLSWEGGDGFSAGFDDLHLDVGAFLNDFVEPVVGEIRNVTGPLQPIIDVIMAPIPVVTDLAELVGQDPITMISVLEASTGADLSLVEAVAHFLEFINEVGDASVDSGNLQLPLGPLNGGGEREAGSFRVNTAAAGTSVSPEEAGKLLDRNNMDGGTGMSADIAARGGLDEDDEEDGRPATFGVPGLSFPFVDDASQVFGMLVGRDAVLIRWDAGTMKAAAGISYDFGPLMLGPIPVTITLGGEIAVKGRFALGYDTSGIRRQLDGGSGVPLFDGIFIDDLDAAGNDVDEIAFIGRVFAGASVDLVIVSAGANGGIELTFGLNLDDRPDPDGKLRIEEIVDKLANPICLFEVSGRIEAFLEAFVEIDLFLTSKRFSIELVRITLLEWSDACEPPSPTLAEPSGEDDEVLYLNVGERRDRRNVAEDRDDDRVEVRQLDDDTVRVTGFGAEEEHSGVSLIVADAGIGDDEFQFLPGEEGASASGGFDIPVVVSGGPGADIISTGDAPDRIYGDAPIEAGTWEGIAYDAFPTEGGDEEALEPGGDQINAGAGDDVVSAGGGDDTVDGQEGEDTILGGDGGDRLSGGLGSDRILGEDGDDQLQGGPIPEPEAGVDPDDDDALAGGGGEDTVSGDFGDDVLIGDDPPSGLFTVDAGSGRHDFDAPSESDWRDWCDEGAGDDDAADIITGSDGDDWLVGGGGDDNMDAGEGDDHACGSAGDDEILGGPGDDELRGNADDDDLFGDAGHDLIFGGDGDDLLEGGEGPDDLFGDAGADLLNGGPGDDILVGDTGSVPDTHVHRPGSEGELDVDRIMDIADQVVRDSAPGNARRESCDRGEGIGDSDCLTGGSGSDALFGGSDGDIIGGGRGVDLLEGNDGPDLLRGGTAVDLLFGNAGEDELYGDSGEDELYGDRPIDNWQGDQPAGADADELYGGPDDDHIEGDGGDDHAFGGAGEDHIEGNDGADTLFGQAGDDDLIGGSDTAGEPDGGEVLVSGGPGTDVIAGDNAIISAGGIVGGRSVELLDLDLAIGGDDHLEGDAGTDYLFGQTGDDTIHGDHGDNAPFIGAGAADYLEGNDGADTVHGEDGNDDLIGGSSAADGKIVADRDGQGAPDEGEALLSGGDGADWIAGDNARINRVLLDDPGDPIQLFDVNSTDVGVSGGDRITGDAGDDRIFGQGNGAQSGQSDPPDGFDNDGDGDVDEDGDVEGEWLGDDIDGGPGDDEIEGNHGADLIRGGDGNDDIAGGGSAFDGKLDDNRVGDGLLDDRDTIHGGAGDDVIAGDNAWIRSASEGPLWLSDPRAVTLFDVNAVDPAFSGGDFVSGGDGDDVIFGQGNGDQDPDQADPLDGFDNDLDGRESEDDSSEYDCGDGFDNDGDGPLDGDEAGCFDAIDEDQPWDGDILLGDAGHDYLEGNHGADWMFGGDGQDDLIGGGSANDGEIIAGRSGIGLHDGSDVIHGDAGHDVLTGDNAVIDRQADGDAWAKIPNSSDEFDLVLREVSMSEGPEEDGDFADDHLLGGAGHDHLYGQQGDDLLEGGEDDDTVVGDLGRIVSQVEDGSRAEDIAPRQPFVEDDIFGAGTLTNVTRLYAQLPGDGAAGDDIILGGQGHDDLHGGPGDDIINGDRYDGTELRDPDDFELVPGEFVWDTPDDVSPLADEDAIFGGYGDDVLWGGRGPDHLYGGHGEDFLDVRPRPATDETPRDPPSWFTWVRVPDGDDGFTEEHYQDSDVIYGGYDADALQANLADTGPNDGDRLFDWAGVYNIYYVCPPAYGDWVITRSHSPSVTDYFESLAAGDGLPDPDTPGSSGYEELGFVYNADIRNNTNPPHPETPGHRYCGDGVQ